MTFKLIGKTVLVFSLLGVSTAASADAEKGKKVFRKCSSCHSVEKDMHDVGPSLYNIIGKQAGTAENYTYSKSLKGSGIVWTEENLKKFVEKPRKFIPKNKMIFGGLRKEKDRDNLIAYLKTLTE